MTKHKFYLVDLASPYRKIREHDPTHLEAIRKINDAVHMGGSHFTCPRPAVFDAACKQIREYKAHGTIH